MKILIAEDDPVSRRMMVQILSSAQAGFVLVTADSGTKAWDVLESNPDVELAMLDLNMPGMTGADWLDRVRADPRFARLAVIVCSGNRDRTTVEAMAARGIRHFVAKPFTRDAVLEKVTQVCGRQPAAAPPPEPPPALRELALARQRMDIDRDTQLELLRHFVRIAELWVGDARRVNRHAGVRALSIRSPRLREMLSQLGAPDIAARFQNAEDALLEYRVRPNLDAMPECLRRTHQLADLIEPELVRLRATLEAM